MPDIASCRNVAFDAPLEFDPGDRWQYGHRDGLGRQNWSKRSAINRSKSTFEKNIFAPLGNARTRASSWGSAQKSADWRPSSTASPTARLEGGSLRRCPSAPSSSWAEAAHSAPPRDYMLFLQMLPARGARANGRADPENRRTVRVDDCAIKSASSKFGRCAPRSRALLEKLRSVPRRVPHKWGYSFDVNERSRSERPQRGGASPGLGSSIAISGWIR